MSPIPSTLHYFASIEEIHQILDLSALPLFEANELNDPFLPTKFSQINFTPSELLQVAIKRMISIVLGHQPHASNPQHPMQKVASRWRDENRFTHEEEIRTALINLLPPVVEQAHNDAKQSFSEIHNFINSRRFNRFFTNMNDLLTWQIHGKQYAGGAIAFRVKQTPPFDECHEVKYQSKPSQILDVIQCAKQMLGESAPENINPKTNLLIQNQKLKSQKEWRLMTQNFDSNRPWISFNKEMIKGIYLGPCVPDNKITYLKNYMQKKIPAASLYVAQIKRTHFEFEFDTYED